MSQNTVKINITADVMEAQIQLDELKKKLRQVVQEQNATLEEYDKKANFMTDRQRKYRDQEMADYDRAANKIKQSITGIINKISELKQANIGDSKLTGLASESQTMKLELDKLRINRKVSLQEEKDYWVSKLATAKEGTATYASIVSKIASISDRMRSEAEKTTNVFSNLGEMVKTAFVYDIAFQAINKLEEGLSELAKHTLELDTDLEQLGTGIAGQLSANVDFVNGIKNASDEQRNFQQATIRSQDVINNLRQSAALIGVPLNQLAEGFMASVGPATKAGMTIDQLTEFTTKMAAVAKASGIQMNNLGREIRDLIEGRRSLLTSEMGLNQAWIDQHKAAGDLVQAYMDMASKFDPMVAKMGDTWSGIKGKITTNIDTIIQYASKDIFAQLKESGKSVSNSISENMDSLKNTIRNGMNSAYDEVHFFYVGFKNTFSAISPILEVVGQSIYGWYLVVKVAFAGVSEVLTRASAGWQEFGAVIKSSLSTWGATFSALNDMQQRFFSGDFAGAKARWEQYKNDVTKINQNLSNDITKIDKDGGDKIAEQEKALTEKIKTIKESTATGNGEVGTARGKSESKHKGMASAFGLMQEELNKEKIQHELSTQEEIDFWNKKLKTAKDGTELYKEIIGQIASLTEKQRSEAKKGVANPFQQFEGYLNEAKNQYDISAKFEENYWKAIIQTADKKSSLYAQALKKYIAAKNQVAQESLAISAQQSKTQEESDLSELDKQKAIYDRLNAFGISSDAQKIAQENDIADKTYAIKKAELDRELKLYQDNDKKISEIKSKQVSLERNYEKEKQKIVTDEVGQKAKTYMQFTNVMENSMASAMSTMIIQAKSFSQAMRQMGLSILEGFVQVIAKMVAHWIMGKAVTFAVSQGWMGAELAAEMGFTTAKTAVHAAGETTKTAATGVGVGARISLMLTEAMASIAAGAAAAWNWLLASFAFLGPGAPIAAAATVGVGVAGAYAMLSKATHSASGGFDIPNGVNPVTQLHQNEMVLPAHIATPLRESLKNGGVGGGNINLHVHAMDSRDVKRFMIDNQDALVSALKSAGRNAKR